MSTGGAAGGQRDNMLQYRVKEDGEVVKEVVLYKVVVGFNSVYLFFPNRLETDEFRSNGFYVKRGF